MYLILKVKKYWTKNNIKSTLRAKMCLTDIKNPIPELISMCYDTCYIAMQVISFFFFEGLYKF